MKPLVSIVIPVFNGEEFLEQAIASALDQDYPNLEILVINDGSVDGSARIANKFGAAIRYFEKSNGGVATALNEGLQRMSGDYFSWLSHDDLYSSNKISAQMARLAELGYPEDVICFSNYEIKDEITGKIIHRSNLKPIGAAQTMAYLATSNDVHGCSLLIPKRAFGRGGVFDEKLLHTQDYEMWFRLAQFCRFELVPECLVMSRLHPNQHSRRSRWRRVAENDRVALQLLRSLESASIPASPFSRGDWGLLTRTYFNRRLPRSMGYAFRRWIGI